MIDAAPAACAGAVATIEVELCTLTLDAATEPNFTVAPLAKFVPVIVTAVPPLVLPVVGWKPVIVGTTTTAASTWNVLNMSKWPVPHDD